MLDQSELLVGMGKLFIKSFMEIGIKTSRNPGEVLFQEGDPAECFYTLISGKVNLYIRGGHKIYTIATPGEMFGWSCLVERAAYSATAECMEPALLLRFDKHVFRNLLENHPRCSIDLYKNLAKTLGNRLLASYDFISCALPPS